MIKRFSVYYWISLGLHLQQMKIFPLSLIKVIHEFHIENELFEARCKDGILAKINFILINFQALASVQDSERALL